MGEIGVGETELGLTPPEPPKPVQPGKGIDEASTPSQPEVTQKDQGIMPEQPPTEALALTPEELSRRAIEAFGLTNDMSRAGFMLPDGQLLDIAGEANHVYHTQIGKIYSQEEMRRIFPPNGIPTNPTDLPEHFAHTIGGIRLASAGDELTLEFYQRPTPAQMKALRQIPSTMTVHVDVTDPISGDTIKSETVNTRVLQYWLRQVKWPETTVTPK